jgi:hypothetical protein
VTAAQNSPRAGARGLRVRLPPPTPALPPPTRSQSLYKTRGGSVCRIRRSWAHVLSGSTLWVARRVCDRHPNARHDQGRVCAGHRPVAQQACRPANGLLIRAGRWGMPVLAASALTDASDTAVCTSNVGHPVTPVAALGRSGDFAVSTTGDQVVRRRGAVVISTQGWRDAGQPRSSGLLQADGTPATCARCHSVLSPTGRDAPRSGADDLCSRSGAFRGRWSRRRGVGEGRQRRQGAQEDQVSARSGTRRAGATYRNHPHTASDPSVNRPSTPNIDQIVAEDET